VFYLVILCPSIGKGLIHDCYLVQAGRRLLHIRQQILHARPSLNPTGIDLIRWEDESRVPRIPKLRGERVLDLPVERINHKGKRQRPRIQDSRDDISIIVRAPCSLVDGLAAASISVLRAIDRVQ
jgi:hypothetical protein